MLGCQDFCGYYDWTFAHVAARHGDEAVRALWTDAIGGESQGHYLRAALADGLRGLYGTWVKTGEDENCDWTFTLDEARNVLRWDMRRCPSKGFLLEHDLNAHTDYCDHCMGWIVPLLSKAGIEVVAHEHNHCGQCWAEMSVRGRPHEPLEVRRDIRDDPNWRHGYIDRWSQDGKVADGAANAAALTRADAVIIAGAEYAGGDVEVDVDAVLIDAPPLDLPRIAERHLGTPADRRPVLLYSYPPALPPVDFAAVRLPRPLALLPLLISHGLYQHRPGVPLPETATLIELLRTALAAAAGPGSVGSVR